MKKLGINSLIILLVSFLLASMTVFANDGKIVVKAKKKTYMSFSGTPATFNPAVGDYVRFSGHLYARGGIDLQNKSIRIDKSSDGNNWSILTIKTTNDTGRFSHRIVGPGGKTYYRARYLGNGKYKAVKSEVVVIRVSG